MEFHPIAQPVPTKYMNMIAASATRFDEGIRLFSPNKANSSRAYAKIRLDDHGAERDGDGIGTGPLS